MWKETELCNERVLRFALKRPVTTPDVLPHPKAGSLWLTRGQNSHQLMSPGEIWPFFEDLSGSTWGRRETDVPASLKALE